MVVLVAASFVLSGPASAAGHQAKPATAGRTTNAPVGTDDWPMFHHDQNHVGVSAETALTASNASSLRTKWQTQLSTAGSYSSPAVVFNAAMGKSVLYIGDQAGSGKGGGLNAVDAATGAVLWSFPAGGNILSSPAVVNGVVYFGTSGNTSHRLIALDAATGAQICSFTTDFPAPGTSGKIDSSPVVADPGDGGGPVVYFGDSGPKGVGTPDQGAFWAINARTCALKWEFGPDSLGPTHAFAANPSGEYAQPAFAHDKNGQPLVVFGSADSDDSVYAVNASTGAQVWRFQTLVGIDTDIGAGPTISAPGVNGSADGVVYETGKDRQVYALDLSTGAQFWSFDLKTLDPTNKGDSQSVAALVGNELVEGWGAGLVALNATSGTKLWSVGGLPTMISSPAIAGPPGSQVILIGDLGGDLRAFDLGGNQLFDLPTGGPGGIGIFSSPAISGGSVYFSNASTGLLYALAPTSADGYWLVASDGGIFSFGGRAFLGSTGAMVLNKPIVGMAPTSTGKGYWLVASDGGIFAFGDAVFFGSTGAIKLNKPIVGMAATPTGKGYWLVASDGGIFTFGDAAFFGSTGAIVLNKPIVGVASRPTGQGYWLVASDGGIFAFGDAAFFGSTGAITLNKPIVGMAATPTGKGYWLVASDGGIFTFGDAAFFGSTGAIVLNKPIVGMTSTPTGKGYWMVASDGGIFTFGDAGFFGSTGALTLNKPIVGMAT